jgi:protein-ribulosamine 3-kinase
MAEHFWSELAGRIATLTGGRAPNAVPQPLGGGCINSAHRLGDWFVKLNRAERSSMFEAEALALTELAATGKVRVPQPLGHGISDGQAWLVLEYLPLAPLSERAAETLGRQLAELHRQPRDHFGWSRDNTIGSTSQPNTPDSDWCRFWRERRLGHQLQLAATNGHGGSLQRRGTQLLDRLDRLLAGHHPRPALLHGDLWGGNAAMTAAGEPVIFDPASYYGDPDADLAMTELFGGFDRRFQIAYREVRPLDDGYPLRRELYNLYHVLNHLNLFGGGYRTQAERMIDRLLAAVP